MIKRICLSLLIAVVAFGGYGKTAHAADEPLVVSLTSIVIFKDLIVTGDFLAVVPYEITFTTEPDENINETFIFSLLSPDGATVNGTVLAYPFFNQGYGKGIVSFYFESGMTTGLAYIFRVQQNPAVYPAAIFSDFIVSNANFSDATDQSAALKIRIINIGQELTIEYSQTLLGTSEAGSTVLAATGELYFLNAIPGLQQMAPELFSVNLEDPDYSKRTWLYTFAESLRTKYDGTLLDEFMTGYGGLFSTTKSASATVLSLFLAIVMIIIGVWKGKASMLSATTDGYAALLLLMLVGFFPMEAAGGIAFMSTVMGGVVLFLNKS